MDLRRNTLLLFSLFFIFCTMSTFAQSNVVEEGIEVTSPEESTTTLETTTTAETTTTETTTTSETTTKATTTKATTPIPPSPSNDAFVYNITEDNITCIMINADFKFLVTYEIAENKTNQTIVHVPAPKDSIHVQVMGCCNCSEKGTQQIELLWGSSIPQNSVKLSFNQSTDGKTWHLSKFRSVLFMDTEGEFKNASNGGKALHSIMNFELTPFDIPLNHSFLCFAKFEVDNVTTTMENMSYIYPVSLNIDGIQLQAFNMLPHQDKFVDEVHCEADKIADVVPIAVGCALAALIIIVLIAYIVGRRRRSAAYQSV